mgnify:CR=1 FL=1
MRRAQQHTLRSAQGAGCARACMPGRSLLQPVPVLPLVVIGLPVGHDLHVARPATSVYRRLAAEQMLQLPLAPA